MNSQSLFRLPCLVLLLVLTLHGCSPEKEPTEQTIVISAATSLTEAITEIGSIYEEKHPIKLIFNFAGSNTLAQQILVSSTADIYISADENWMDHVQKKDRLVTGSRSRLLSNQLVVIANKSAPLNSVSTPSPIANLSIKYLALADPEAVPAGRYAKIWLQKTKIAEQSLFKHFSSKIAPTSDVRAALALVASDPSIIGIVYKSDTLSSKEVKILYSIPLEDGPKIQYTAALVKKTQLHVEAKAFFHFLKSPKAQSMFEKHGFISDSE